MSLIVLFLTSLIITRAGFVESCIQQERLALLQLDSYLRSQRNPEYPHTFDGIDEVEEDKYNCCSWRRVKCNNTTQHVVELDLSQMWDQEDGPSFFTEGRVFNVSMLEPFKQLTGLDLSMNNIRGFVEKNGSTELSTLKNLQSLVFTGFRGQIFLSDLTSLKTLNLESSYLNETALQGLCVLKNLLVLNLTSCSFRVPPSCFQKMSFLQIIDLSFNYMNESFQDIISSNLTSLRYLDLSGNNLKGELLPNCFQNLTSLEHLDLSGNNIEGVLSLSSFSNHNRLNFLDLSGTHLQVQTEDFAWLPSFQLQHLGLRGCSLNKPYGTVPMFLSGQNNLTFIDLSYNSLVGSFPSFLIRNKSIPRDFGLENEESEALAFYSRRPLEILIISGNNFHGMLPGNIGSIFPRLKVFNLSSCHFEGPIPTSIAHMSLIEYLDLSYNNFSGELPRQLLTGLTSLNTLILNDNNLEGEIIPNYMNLTGLVTMKLRNNHFGGTIKDALSTSSQLTLLDISNNMVTGYLPCWIGNLIFLGTLSMSNNVMEGQIPGEICNLLSLTYLDLSENNFNRSIPSCSEFPNLSVMLLRQNKFTGGIPIALSTNPNLIVLDLRENQLSGGLPLWINNFQGLEILLLGGNNFRGQIPRQLCHLQGINLLDLSRNQLSGRIPTCFANMSFGSQPTYTSTDTDTNINSYDYIPLSSSPIFPFHYMYRDGVDEIDDLLVKNLYLPYLGFDLSHMSLLDLSNNNFSGIIPPELGNLRHLHSINLSCNCLSGSIPDNLSNMKSIEGLDLSYNNLSGIIPYQLDQLYFLAKFNVSYNNLTGRTPEAGQFGNFDENSYLGNPGLCVSVVSKSCNAVSDNDAHYPTSTTIEENGGEGVDVEDFLWCFGVTSFITFTATITVLCINRQWRESFFDFVEWHLLWWLL